VRDPVGLCVSREGCGEAEGGFEVDYEGAEGGVVWDQGAFFCLEGGPCILRRRRGLRLGG